MDPAEQGGEEGSPGSFAKASAKGSLQKHMELLVAGLVANAPAASAMCQELSTGMQEHFHLKRRHGSSQAQLGQELATVADATANVLAHTGQPNTLTDAHTIGIATECGLTAASQAVASEADLSSAHLSFVSALAAARAAAERVASWGAPGTQIGEAAADAAKGTHAASQAAADAATEAAAMVGAARSKADTAVVAALRSFGLCPGEQSILGAEHVARAVAHHCVHVAPLDCGLQIHMAASRVLAACSAPVAPLARFVAFEAAPAVAKAAALSGASPDAVAEAVKFTLQAAGADPSMLPTAKIASRASAFAKAASLGSPVEVGTAAKEAADRFTGSAAFKESLATGAAVSAIVQQKLQQGATADFSAKQAREAANATGAQGSEHAAVICRAAVEALAAHAARFSSAKAVGAEAKHMALSIAAALPQNMGATTAAFLSLREALYLGATAATRAVLQQELREGFGADDMLQQAFEQAKLTGTVVPIPGSALAHIFGDVVVKESLRRGLSTESIAKLLQDSRRVLQKSFASQDDVLPSDIATSAAESAANTMAEVSAQLGLQPAVIHATCKKLLQNLELPDDVVAHLASASALRAVTRDTAVVRPDKAGTTARLAIGWRPWEDKSLPAARLAATEASTAAARERPPGKVTEAAEAAAISAGLPLAAASRLALRIAAEAAALHAARQGASAFDVGTAAHDAVVGGLAANASRTHALLATAVPAAVHAITQSTGRLQTAALGSRARSAADGAMGKGDPLAQIGSRALCFE